MKIRPRRKDMPEYAIWCRMIQRCYNPKCDSFPWYGALGIIVCQEWRDSFDAFLVHVGLRPSDKHTIDRIDNSRGYEVGNVRWATREENMNNTSRSKKLTYGGMTMGLNQWARHLNMQASTLCIRLKRMPFEHAIGPYVR
jgi:hypothetical protein